MKSLVSLITERKTSPRSTKLPPMIDSSDVLQYTFPWKVSVELQKENCSCGLQYAEMSKKRKEVFMRSKRDQTLNRTLHPCRQYHKRPRRVREDDGFWACPPLWSCYAKIRLLSENEEENVDQLRLDKQRYSTTYHGDTS